MRKSEKVVLEFTLPQDADALGDAEHGKNYCAALNNIEAIVDRGMDNFYGTPCWQLFMEIRCILVTAKLQDPNQPALKLIEGKE